MALRFGILGPLLVEDGSGPVEVTAPKQRALLAALLLRRGEVVTTDSLVHALWSESPPASAAKLVQVYVSQLRQLLGSASPLLTHPTGYELRLDEDALDSDRFERLLATGRSALADGNAERARRLLTAALELWRGPALADVVYEDFARLEAERLEERRIEALEERFDAELALGESAALVPELRALAALHPGRERVWGQLMLALYRADRQTEALDVFTRARAALLEGLGLEPGDELRRLQRAILAHDPALAAPPTAAGRTLPAPLTPLFGREEAVTEVAELLRRPDVRLLTLVGAGGTGKTELALAVGRSLQRTYANGAVLVELAPVRDPALVPAAVAGALGVALDGRRPVDALHEHVRSHELLLVVDNAEHLDDVGSALVTLLQAAPGVTVLVTSRSVLHVSGEHVYPVSPLAPEAASELFLARAGAASAAFDPVAADADVVREVCARLDGLPLAIELAAPRVRTLTLEELRARLAQRLPLLADGPRDLPARQRTMRATLDWSYDLLPEEAARALARVSVFAGSFTLDAAEVVAGATLDAVTALTEHSLLHQHPDARFSLLEAVREYAAERLLERGDERPTRIRLLDHLIDLARSASLTMEGDGPMRHELVRPESATIRTALDWAREHGEALRGLELATLLENFWVTSELEEGEGYITALLDVAADVPAPLHALALRAKANTVAIRGEYDTAATGYEAALEAYRAVGDDRGVAVALQRLAGQELGRGDNRRARALLEESLELSRSTGFEKAEAVALGILAGLEADEGKSELALALNERSIELAAGTGFTWFETRARIVAAGLLSAAGRREEAEHSLRDALALVAASGDRPSGIEALGRLALAVAMRGAAREAGLLWGAAEAELGRLPAGRAFTTTWMDVSDLAGVAGPDFERARREGRSLPFEAALELAGSVGRD